MPIAGSRHVVELALDRLDAGVRHRPRRAQPLTLGELHDDHLAPARHERSQILLLELGARADEALEIGSPD